MRRKRQPNQGEISRYVEWKNEIRRIAALWADVRRYSLEWGPDCEQVAARREEAERRAQRLRILVSEVRRMKPENKSRWYADIDAAAREPQPKVRAARKPATRAQRVEAIAYENRLPLWHGPNGDWPAPRRVVGVAWCNKLSRWVIRFYTRLGQYTNTETHGLTPAELADEVDRIKAHLVFRGHLSGCVRVGAWNDKTSVAFNLKVLEAQQGDALDSDDALGIIEPFYAHLVRWLKDQSEYSKHCMEAARAGRLPDTFKRFPKQAFYDKRLLRMTSLSSKEAAKFADVLSNAPNAS